MDILYNIPTISIDRVASMLSKRKYLHSGSVGSASKISIEYSVQKDILIFDLRTFIQFSKGRMPHSLNVSVPMILLKQPWANTEKLERIISLAIDQEIFRNRHLSQYCIIIVSRSSCAAGDDLAGREELQRVWLAYEKLRKHMGTEEDAQNIYWMNEGFDLFMKRHPEYIEVPTINSSTLKTTTAPASLTSPFPFKRTLSKLEEREKKKIEPVETFQKDSYLAYLLQEPYREQKYMPGCRDKLDIVKYVRVLPGLYLGNAEMARDYETLENFGIRRIINVTESLPNYWEYTEELPASISRTLAADPIEYKRISIYDTNAESLLDHIEVFIDLLCTGDRENTLKRASFNDYEICPITLVHCEAGESRSVSLVLAFFIWLRHWTVDEALNYLKEMVKTNSNGTSNISEITNKFELLQPSLVDPQKNSLGISPNLNFLGQLLLFQDRIFKEKDIT